MDEVETLIKNRELIDDIDKDDVENPQLVVEYVNEIYDYFRQLEIKQEIRPNYLKSSLVNPSSPTIQFIARNPLPHSGYPGSIFTSMLILHIKIQYIFQLFKNMNYFRTMLLKLNENNCNLLELLPCSSLLNTKKCMLLKSVSELIFFIFP